MSGFCFGGTSLDQFIDNSSMMASVWSLICTGAGSRLGGAADLRGKRGGGLLPHLSGIHTEEAEHHNPQSEKKNKGLITGLELITV